MFSKSEQAVPDIRLFTVLPPLRCCFYLNLPGRSFCGERAVLFRPTDAFGRGAFFCRAHADATDQAIVADVLVRRVRVLADAVFAGVSMVRQDAHSEAIDQLEAAIKARGGLLNLHSVTSEVGRLQAPGSCERPKHERGGR
jgi:hypothetical protein